MPRMPVLASICKINQYYVAALIIVLGIALRLTFLLQNRCLFIDESNIARNLYERNYARLTLPLSYEQYAPPLFLWIEKFLSSFLGFGELSLRLFPFICGILSVILLYRLLGYYGRGIAIYYPLFLFATGFIYIRYSAELKQYMCDTLVVLILLLTAIRKKMPTDRRATFTIIWIILGSVAIWISMPSVFMLAGCIAYYMYSTVTERKYSMIYPLIAISIAWLTQFAGYYVLILRPQIHSDYLYNCHTDFFLSSPFSLTGLQHDGDVLAGTLSTMGGKWALSIAFHALTIFLGIYHMARTNKAELVLFISPVLLLIVASLSGQYAFTPRLTLFTMPLLLTLVCAGLSTEIYESSLIIKASVIIIAAICLFNFNAVNLFYRRYDNEEIVSNLTFLKNNGITGRQLYIRDLAGPAYIYYTSIHPSHQKWQSLKGAQILTWNTSFDSLARSFNGRKALLYSWAPANEMEREQQTISKYCHTLTKNCTTGGSAFVYEKKSN